MEALILLLDMIFMWYLCWRLFRAGEGQEADLGLLGYKKSDKAR